MMKAGSFKKVLIANRGEIALRIMRTCRDMGITPVAVYSEADRRSPHAVQAEEAVCIGPAPSLESYLNIERIVDAALKIGADAIHPGYGFLSENAALASACYAASLVFIGPSAESIRQMGSKTEAKRLAVKCGVPVVPGYEGADQSLETLRARAIEAGLPVLIKASAGGGGKGMRVVRSAEDLDESIESARGESLRSFGDSSLLIERLVEGARHVEVQILGDRYGNLIHLFERDCSLQRRHQKIIEETPSPALTPELRSRMTEAALAIGRAIGYYNAGTVEFIVSPDGEFYFIEVNTRLQVEHPVTEMTTGIDLVRLQIEVAEGKPLPFGQQDMHSRGHAIEARIYAEDPVNNFLPSAGKIVDWHPPLDVAGLRIDSGVETGSEVSIYYDPMLAKMIAHGPDRETALRKLTFGLKALAVQGIATNQSFLINLLENPAFADGRTDTAFIDAHVDELLVAPDATEVREAGISVAVYRKEMQRAQPSFLPGVPLHFRNNPYRRPPVRLKIGDRTFDFQLHRTQRGAYAASCQDWQGQVRVVSLSGDGLRVEIDGRQRSFRISGSAGIFFVDGGAGSFRVELISRYPESTGKSEHESASSPMPGQVLKLLVEEGQTVSAGDPLIVLEAMKMEQTLRANIDGFVEAVLVKRGDVVGPGDDLIRIAKRITT
ncbi:MAG TPA: acetyl-CoA carboxylase biotin carboxylase subunit [Blastocatellia bacterium]